MIGFRSGMLTVIRRSKTIRKRAMWVCLCDCGNEHVVMGKYLRRFEVKSCGCLNRCPCNPEEKIKHGHTAGGVWSPTYITWASMITRCLCPSSSSYYKYGAKGIVICDRWRTFSNFLEDMGERPIGKTIDRIDNSKGYEPSNCRWATAQEQMRNQTKTRWITLNEETLPLCVWSERLNISPSILFARLKRHPPEIALTSLKGVDFRKFNGSMK